MLHEFAHQLDFEDFAADGVPALGSRGDKLSWARVMKMEFVALRAADEDRDSNHCWIPMGRPIRLNFFAVATEAFFERPRALRRQHSRCTDELERFFRQDPALYSSELAPRR